MIPLKDENAPLITPASAALTAVTALAFAWQLTASGPSLLHGSHSTAAQALFAAYGFTPAQPGWHTVLTHVLLHVSLPHLASNILFLQLFGPAMEARTGTPGFLALYAISAAGAALLYLAFQPGSPHPLAGASGAVSGVTAAYAVTYPRNRMLLITPSLQTAAVPAALLLGLWLLWQLALPLATSQSLGALAAHAGGAAAGAVLALALRFLTRP